MNGHPMERYGHNMKLLRIAGLSLFLLSAVTFAGYCGYEVSRNDIAGPVIEFAGEDVTVGVTVTDEELLKNVTAYDEKDGNVTDSLLIETISDFIKPGQRMITYAAFDKNSNVTKRERKLNYTDYESPRFSLEKPLRFAVGDAANILDFIKVWDCIDGDLTEKIKYEEPDYSFGTAEDSHQIKFQVTNSAGDTSILPTEVQFYIPAYNSEKLVPEILLEKYLIYLKTGETFNPEAFLKGVRINQMEYSIIADIGISIEHSTQSAIARKDISISTNVNTRKPGVYQVEYSMTAQNGYSGTTKLLVVVEE